MSFEKCYKSFESLSCSSAFKMSSFNVLQIASKIFLKVSVGGLFLPYNKNLSRVIYNLLENDSSDLAAVIEKYLHWIVQLS